MLEEIKRAYRSYVKAHQLIVEDGFWKYLIVPGIAFCLLFVIVAYIASILSSTVIGYVDASLNSVQFDWFVLVYLFKAIQYIVAFFVKSSLLILFFWGYKNFLLIMMSPLFAFISERTHQQLTGR
ncbi:MAG: hypothetical protein HRT72_00655, partial [Flavobacteriales bacterium]|nr:hypothetical protein [Flavobacteriales bacterium]